MPETAPESSPPAVPPADDPAPRAEAEEAAGLPAAGGPPSVLDEASPRRPASPGEVFRVFTRLALQGFGGVLPIAQRELVDRERWLTREQFLEMLAVAQVLPGPNVVNLSLMFGDRAFGWRGALAALGGMLLAPLGVVLALTVGYLHYAQHPVVAGMLRGMGAVAAGLVIATAIKLMSTLRTSSLGPLLAAVFAVLTFVTIAWLRWPLVWVVAGLGSVAVGVAWLRLR